MRSCIALWLLEVGFWMLPQGAFKSKLNTALWVINMEMQAVLAAAAERDKHTG